jgi:alkyl hydroperoxide reductase subunit AhpC
MSLRLGDTAPDFEASSTLGPIHFYEWMGDKWCVLFSHPGDFTPVCTTEMGAISRLKGEFDRRGVCVLGLSIDSLERHTQWVREIEETQGIRMRIPLIADPERRIATLYDMVHPNLTDATPVRTLFVIDPSKKVRLTTTYPPTTGRNFGEVLRAIDSLKLTSEHEVATPAGWERGDDVIILPSVSDEAAEQRYECGWRAEKSYLRYVKDPTLIQ